MTDYNMSLDWHRNAERAKASKEAIEVPDETGEFMIPEFFTDSEGSNPN